MSKHKALTDEYLVEWYECRRKFAFDNLSAAEAKAQFVMREVPLRNNGQQTILVAYQCKHCDLFHIGKPRKKMADHPPSRVVKEAKRLWDFYESTGKGQPFGGGAKIRESV